VNGGGFVETVSLMQAAREHRTKQQPRNGGLNNVSASIEEVVDGAEITGTVVFVVVHIVCVCVLIAARTDPSYFVCLQSILSVGMHV